LDGPETISGRTRITALIAACAVFMQDLDSTILSTALPTMAKTFSTDAVHMNVTLTAYLLSIAVCIPASGWIADRFGLRTVFGGAMALFTLASVVCSLADSLWFLTLARVLQGIGGGLMLPVARLVVFRTVPRHELFAAVAWAGTPALIGPMAGPLIGGLIVTYYSWRWIFYVNVPIGLLGILLTSRFINDDRSPAVPPFDSKGFILAGMALSCLIFALDTAGSGVVPGWLTASLLSLGIILGLQYVQHTRQHDAPILDLSLLRLTLFRVAMTAMMLFRIGTGAIPFLLPLMLQLGFGATPLRSGLLTFTSSVGAFFMRPIAQSMLRLCGFRTTLIWNGVISAVFIAACAAFRPTWPVAAMYAVLLIGGFFRALQFTAYTTIAYGDVPKPRMSAATGLFTSAQQLSATIGVPLAALVLYVSMALTHHTTAQSWDFSMAFGIATLFMLGAAITAIRLPSLAGDDLAGRVIQRR
jgi:EmrB/QacA subfamily drug resistance transporter